MTSSSKNWLSLAYLKMTIPLKEAASLLWNFWSFATLTLLSLNVLDTSYIFKKPSVLVWDPIVFK